MPKTSIRTKKLSKTYGNKTVVSNVSINKKGIVTNSFKVNKGAADLEILMHKNLILIPMMKNNNLTAFQYD